jgi:hypothetical protein
VKARSSTVADESRRVNSKALDEADDQNFENVQRKDISYNPKSYDDIILCIDRVYWVMYIYI